MPRAISLLAGARSLRSPRNRRRRFVAVSVAGLGLLAAALGVSYAGDSGDSSLVVSAAQANYVYPVASGNTAPATVTALKYTDTNGIGGGTFSATVANVKTPTWAPVAGSAGSVTSGGDVAVFDARSATLADHTKLRVSVYVTNLNGLQQAYSSFALPVNVYQCASTCTSTGAWSQASSVVASATYLTNSDGFLSFTLPAGYFYDLTIDTGGSVYTISTANASNLNPSFYFKAIPL